ncbi:unnamed protein product [Parascedosporium putredinis]|uniref:Glucose-methanol-choline oxidoreductase N-terminal domain-containing protein n=1 Tax=Parascedosporium putredinis TaxID=1442378 RepID=A0A9P1HA44_9PEZI|nr:unnamed protein product [Parascedosporium putredinis]CAI8002290.1 unnamed protein product [Parascedosporium putredinis]
MAPCKPHTLAYGLLALASLAAAYPASVERATLLGRQEDALDEYDYIIVGGGTAGLTVGDRLSEDGKYSVLAIEYGYLERDGYRPGRTTYNITSQPSPELNNRTFNVGIGCIVGGSSAVNGQVFQRGTAGDYDIWGSSADPTPPGAGKISAATSKGEPCSICFVRSPGLAPNSPIAHKTKTKTLTAMHGGAGHPFQPAPEDVAEAFNITYDLEGWGQDPDTRIHATYARGLAPPSVSFWQYFAPSPGGPFPLYDAMKNFPGVDVPVDGANGQNGLYWFTTSMDPVTFNRSYARTGHWDGLDRDNYELLPATKVNKIVFDGDRAAGVQLHPATSATTSASSRPARSGIGPRKLLKAADIEVKVDLPGVGSNFQDHHYIPGVRFTWGNDPEVPELDLTTNLTGNGIALGAFLGLKAFSPDLFEDIASRYESQNPADFLPKGTDCTVVAGFLECMLGGSPSCSPQNVHPVSRGTVTLNATDPEAEVIVDYRAASNPVDIDIMVEAVKFFRRFITTGDLAVVYHPVGTAAKMPRKWGGVVDEELLVYGVEGLSVVDASIMPTLVGSTTSMTVYAIAEKAADLIKARA